VTNFSHDVIISLLSTWTVHIGVVETVGGQLIRLSVTRMMMMDMGMYGTYGKPDSYPNYVFSGQGNHHHHHHHHQPSSVGGHVSVPPSPEVAPTHYYPQTAVAPYSSSSSESFLTADSGTSSSTPPQGFYSPTGAVLHENGSTTAIISSENGLSYTNLDYASSSSYPNQQQHTVASVDPHQSYHVQQSAYREDSHHHHHHHHHHPPSSSNLHQTTVPPTSHPRTEHDQQLHHQSSSHHHHHHHHESDYPIAVGGTSNYLHQLPSSDESLHYQTQIQQSEFSTHPSAHYKEENSDTTTYHILQQSSHLQHPHQHGHHHQQQHSHAHHSQQHQQQQQQAQVPTYKWMQVKRNVPKPVGKCPLSHT